MTPSLPRAFSRGAAGVVSRNRTLSAHAPRILTASSSVLTHHRRDNSRFFPFPSNEDHRPRSFSSKPYLKLGHDEQICEDVTLRPIHEIGEKLKLDADSHLVPYGYTRAKVGRSSHHHGDRFLR